MKKVYIIFLLSLLGIGQIFAQGFQQKISFDKFSQWANEIHLENMEIGDFSATGNLKTGDVEELTSYAVDFANEDATITIRIQDMDDYETYVALSKENFVMDAFTMMYIQEDESGHAILCITNSDINAFLTIRTMPALSKDEIIAIYEKIQIDKLLH